jgi:hypothetical protein
LRCFRAEPIHETCFYLTIRAATDRVPFGAFFSEWLSQQWIARKRTAPRIPGRLCWANTAIARAPRPRSAIASVHPNPVLSALRNQRAVPQNEIPPKDASQTGPHERQRCHMQHRQKTARHALEGTRADMLACAHTGPQLLVAEMQQAAAAACVRFSRNKAVRVTTAGLAQGTRAIARSIPILMQTARAASSSTLIWNQTNSIRHPIPVACLRRQIATTQVSPGANARCNAGQRFMPRNKAIFCSYPFDNCLYWQHRTGELDVATDVRREGINHTHPSSRSGLLIYKIDGPMPVIWHGL